MKKIFKVILSIFIVSIIFLALRNYYIKDYSVKIEKEYLDCSTKFKGLKGAIDFVGDNKNNFYIAYKNKIQFVGNNGQSYNVINNPKFCITAIEYFEGDLYFVSQNSLYCINIKTKELKEIMNDLSNFGDYDESRLTVCENFLYISIGAATNSGVVGDDNIWLEEYPYIHDITPYMITLRGLNFGDKKTGAYLSSGSKSIEGQIVTGHFPGNASIIVYNMETGDMATFAWGIRNVTSMDFDSRSKLFASVGGMENRGLRPVIGDVDYIFEIQAKTWYGWPDYSGGDPVSSPRFKGEDNKEILFILDKHPTTNPPAPIYQHDKVNSLTCLAIDNIGTIQRVDTIYFLDDFSKTLYSLDTEGILDEILVFQDESLISSIKYINNEMLILDSKSGIMYNLEKKDNDSTEKTKIMVAYWFFIFLIICVSGYLACTIRTNIKNKKRE
ncbi:hypothetical protein [Clostridium sp. DL1XJH146]